MAYLPGEILFGYLSELDEKSRTIYKNHYPDLDDYDSGLSFIQNKHGIIRQGYFHRTDSRYESPGVRHRAANG
ncbi:MAG: hypothetical protein ACYS1A_20305, partial [Planctomycetota bacterium]